MANDFMPKFAKKGGPVKTHVWGQNGANDGTKTNTSKAKKGQISRLYPYGEKTRAGHGPEQQLFAQRPSMINQAGEVFWRGRFPAFGPSPAVPSTFMPLP